MNFTGPILLDGATGTELIKRGMPSGSCTEAWILQHPNFLVQIQKGYVAAGSQILLAPTFGANRGSLARYQLEDQVEEYNRRLISLTKQAAGPETLIAADLAPIGLGADHQQDLVSIYLQQASACQASDADLFVVETMISLEEAEAAVRAIRAVSRLPILVTCVCNCLGTLPCGGTAAQMLRTLEPLSIDGFGMNCCTPDVIKEQLPVLRSLTSLPLIAKPSAGLPRENGQYPYSPKTWASLTADLRKDGAVLLGGCCGTDPTYIAALRSILHQSAGGLSPVSFSSR